MKFLQMIMLCSLLALMLSCSSSPVEDQPAKPATIAPNNEKGNEAAIAVARANPLEGIVNAFQKSLAVQTFRAKLESTTEGRTSLIAYEFVAPDRYRMINGPTELIMVGPDAYLKTLGSWQKVASSMQSQMKVLRDPQVVEKLKQSSDAKFIQADALDGKPMLVYECTSTNVLGFEGKTTAKTWVGIADGLPYKAEFEGETGSAKSKGVLAWSDYNADIKIEPPIK